MTVTEAPPTLVTVIVLNWNGRKHLEACLPALAAQTFRDFELVVVDNGSADDSLPWLARQGPPLVRVIALEKNLGFAGGNSEGLRRLASRSEFIVLLNNDTAPEPDWLAALLDAARGDSRRGSVASLILDWSGVFIDSAGDGLRVTGFGYQRFHGWPRAAAPASGLVFSACAGAALYRRVMLEEVGFFDERFFMNGEDSDLGFRSRLAGWDAWYCANAIVRHRAGATQGVNSAASIYFHERNRIWSVAKCMPARLLWKYSWVYLLEVPARAFLYIRRRRFIAWLRGVFAGIGGAWSHRTERRRIKTHRRVEVSAIDRYLVYPRQLGGENGSRPPRA